ncbi:hypothetical protein DET1048 [Dehalococcoides mccartyi 195]|uniref:Uncharacterized protein n=1 Tax=Dehalococcoides mccartyi (strain ATCC BAA-2266 / KCTC 15142 / 195) TaxID=243164 RepID=Q3Z7N6_DEHM1|nr:hypothetical protein DET1048 [Dehalococcoides mccartyi 195]
MASVMSGIFKIYFALTAYLGQTCYKNILLADCA